MITSKQIIKLGEEYFKSQKVYNRDVPVYNNPTVDDLKELVKENPVNMPMRVRIIIDRKAKSVYVWNAYLATHENTYPLLGLNFTYRNNPESLYGEAPVVNNKILASKQDFLDIFASIDKYIYILDDKSTKNNSSSYKQYVYVKDWFEHDKDWMFVDRYISGFNKELESRKNTFLLNVGLK